MKKILIVDDMEVTREMAAYMLSSQYTTFCAASGREAIEIYRRERPDMILSDFRMPGMSGFDLQLALQKEYNATIPFMFMTADKDEETESKGFDIGAMDFIRKPLNPDVLLRRVGNIMQTVDQIQGLKKHASIDSLTGLLNKSSSEAELKDICRHATGALMMIDLDSFKLVNDIHGHAMGDKVLMTFADIIRAAVRPADLVGRLGGDEFIAFCHGMLDEAGIAHKSEFINERLVSTAKELMGEDMNIPLGASIGCVFVPKEGTDFSELFKKADKALYIVKQNGKHGYNIYSETKDSEQDESADRNNLTHVEMILGERGQAEGALQLPFENFRTLYRFLRRTMLIFDKPVSILLFSLNKTGESACSLAEANEQLFDTIQATLRKGDAITQNGKNQILVLLINTGYPDLEHAVARIRKNWQEQPANAEFSFDYEWSVLEP